MNDQTVKRSWATIQFEIGHNLEQAASTLEIEEMATWLMFQNGASACETKTGEGTSQIVEATFPNDKLTDTELNAIKAAMEEYGLSNCLRSLKVSSVARARLAQTLEGRLSNRLSLGKSLAFVRHG